MTLDPIAFARSQKTKITPCYSLVYAWLKAHGVNETPSDSQSRRWWIAFGSEQGMVKAAEYMSLTYSEGKPGDVAVFDQPGNAPILGVLAENGFGVVRSFGRLAVWKPTILRAWGLTWEK
jgi:hypothetical protein